MHFLYPAFLFALFTLAIPLLIHLFNFRRYQKVYFSNVQF
ncbi:MAG TPA: BatA domain-containing protein, partial [Mucilaginibacter sp.]|nr:BatA domain-containing protein [Mucilaginibacter sp.]